MKKIFTTLTAVALLATAANAEVVVKYDGKQLQNGDEIVLTNADFTDHSFPEYELYLWTADADLEVEAGIPSVASCEANDKSFQWCPGGTCINWPSSGVLSLSAKQEKPSYAVLIHYNVEQELLPNNIDSYIKCSFVDDDEEPFTVTIRVKTSDSAVDAIDMENAQVAAVYDMQGRRVGADFRGAAIVVYDNGKALKQIRK